MRILVLNAGSSSIKYRLFDLTSEHTLASGQLERIGEPVSRHHHQWQTEAGEHHERTLQHAVADHHQALAQIMAQLTECGALEHPEALAAIGHRVVHGGEVFSQPVLIDDSVVHAIRDMIPLAPLHNPANLEGIEVTRQLCPNVPQVAVFDTAFHQSMPPHAFHYALPHTYYQQQRVRRYGFHGTSHQSVARQTAEYLQRPLEQLNLITLHLGNGCSAAAIEAGRSVDTSMGMTPLEGLVMGTRCGDLDPAIPFYLMRETGLSAERLEQILNSGSGLKGLCEMSDMREVKAAADSGDDAARLARDLFAYRVKKTIGAYLAVLGRVDALVFTGGIGENDSALRLQICDGLSGLGIQLRSEATLTGDGVQPLHSEASPIPVLVVPTHEELEIARAAQQLL